MMGGGQGGPWPGGRDYVKGGGPEGFCRVKKIRGVAKVERGESKSEVLPEGSRGYGRGGGALKVVWEPGGGAIWEASC